MDKRNSGTDSKNEVYSTDGSSDEAEADKEANVGENLTPYGVWGDVCNFKLDNPWVFVNTKR